ncbi:MAG: hypothetical protein ABIE07_01225 [Candidatus Zixiibacteriota bacterium]
MKISPVSYVQYVVVIFLLAVVLDSVSISNDNDRPTFIAFGDTDAIWMNYEESSLPLIKYWPRFEFDDSLIIAAYNKTWAKLDSMEIEESSISCSLIVAAIPRLSIENFTGDGKSIMRWNLAKRNYDGIPPSDYQLFTRLDGSMGGYEEHIIVRSGNNAVYQFFVGTMRGYMNMSANKGFDVFSNILASTRYGGLDLLIMHNNIDNCPFTEEEIRQYEDEHQITPCYTMADLCDLPVPYYWNGERLAFERINAKSFYTNLLKNSHGLLPRDAVAITKGIEGLGIKVAK